MKKKANQEKLLKEKGDQLKELDEEIIRIKSELADAQAIHADWNASKDAETKLKEKQQTLQQKRQALFAERQTINTRIEDRRKHVEQLQKLGRETECPTCFRPLMETYESTLHQLNQEINRYEKEELSVILNKLSNNQQQLASLEADLKTNQSSLSQLKEKLTRLEERNKQLTRLNQQQSNLKSQQETIHEELKNFPEAVFDPNELSDVTKTIEQLKPSHREFTIKNNQVLEIPKMEAALTKLQVTIEQTKKDITRGEKAISDLQFSESDYKAAKTDQQMAEHVRDECRNELDALKDQRSQLLPGLNKVQMQLETHHSLVEEIAGIKVEFAELDDLDRLFQQFKTEILVQIRPSISRHASDLFNRVTQGRYENIKVTETFDFEIMDDGKYFPINRFSGGEIDLANLCLRIAISKTIAELAGSDTGLNFLGFDEIFGSQDEERRAEILLALDLLKEQYRQIYIITHIDSVKEHFPCILEVRKTVKGSKVNWLN